MVYTALPDRRMPYDNDGTIVGFGSTEMGVTMYPSAGDQQEWQDNDLTATTRYSSGGSLNTGRTYWFFYPEQREVTATYCYFWTGDGVSSQDAALSSVQGSNDSVNGLDGTWETASLSSGAPPRTPRLDDWRANIKPISFTGPKRVARFVTANASNRPNVAPYVFHVYGEKAAGQTPDDIIYINHDDTPGVEFTAPEDFGDQPQGTTVVRQFRIKNTSATKTANTINIQCNDADFAISEDGVVWVVTINITSLSAGAESATLYVRCTTPAPGNLLGPRFARIVTTVASYT